MAEPMSIEYAKLVKMAKDITYAKIIPGTSARYQPIRQENKELGDIGVSFWAIRLFIECARQI